MNDEHENTKEAERRVKEWNKRHPVGCQVVLTLDDGSKVNTVIKHQASVVGGYIPVVWVWHKKTGCCRLEQVRGKATVENVEHEERKYDVRIVR